MKNNNKHPEVQKRKIKTINENLRQEDFENMMKHSSYKRGKGGIKQVR